MPLQVDLTSAAAAAAADHHHKLIVVMMIRDSGNGSVPRSPSSSCLPLSVHAALWYSICFVPESREQTLKAMFYDIQCDRKLFSLTTFLQLPTG
jgi:hypothetical protein